MKSWVIAPHKHIPPTTGTITFTDQDLGDDISFSVTGNATATYNGGAVPIDPAVDISQLIDAAAISFADGGLSPMAINKPSTGLSIHKPLISIG